MNLNFFNVLILLGIVHGLIFSFILLINHKLNSQTNRFLAFSILALCFSNLQYLLVDIGLDPGYQNNSFVLIPFEYLMVPMFYLFVKSYLQSNTTKRLFIFMISPFILMLIYQIIATYARLDRLINLLNPYTEFSSLIFSLFVIFLTFKAIYLYEKKQKKLAYKQNVFKTTKWLKTILFFSILLCVTWFISLTFLNQWFDNKGFYKFYPLWIGISILIYWIAYLSIFQNSIFNDRIEIRKIKQEESTTSIKKLNPEKFEEIIALIESEKLFLNPKFSLNDLSKETGLSKSYLSQIINSNSKNNFNDIINIMRVENVKKMLKDKRFNNYTISSIGLESGFSTRSSFFSVFNKITRTTPNKYKKLVQNI